MYDLETTVSRILLIEDEIGNQKIVTACLSQHEIHIVGDLKTARDHLSKSQYDLVLLDVKLPDGDGFAFLLELQNTVMADGIPVVLLTGQTQSADKVTGYSLGADDYITKPIDPIVFKARIEAKLRKLERNGSRENVLKTDGFTISMEKQSVSYASSGVEKTLQLTTLEFKIFVHLIKHKDHVLSREQLIEAVWGSGVSVTDRTVDSHVSHLRKHLADSPLAITSVYGAGYKLSAPKKAA